MSSSLFSIALGKRRKLSPKWTLAFLVMGYCKVVFDKDDTNIFRFRWLFMRRAMTRRKGNGERVWYIPTKQERITVKAKNQERAKISYL